MPRIAYILSRFPYLTETFILREMLELRRLGLDVHVFSMFPPLPTPIHQQAREMLPYTHYSSFLLSRQLILAQFYFLLSSPIRYIRAFLTAIWQCYREPLVLSRVLITFPKAVYFAKQMKDLGIEHIHAHFVWINGIAARIAHDLTDITFSLHPHAFGLFMRDQLSVRRQLELASGVVTVSQYHRRYIADLCPQWSSEEIEVVHYGLDPSEFTPGHIAAEDNTIRILSVGSLVGKKGHKYLIDACAQLIAKGHKLHCSIVGNGPLQNSLQALINECGLQDCVSLLGAKTQAEIKSLYCHSDIFALPCVITQQGDRDGMPNVLLEAMAMQLPVVTTPVTGIPELVMDGENGFLVPEQAVDALTRAIEQLIDDTALRRVLGQHGRQTVLAGFDVHQTAAQLATIFQDIHNRSRTA